ncbi:MAG TPA: hypothetical protein GXZ82_09915 [Firmicutes bacterium]|nr:hypothetical protein [Bacillota bacterium]
MRLYSTPRLRRAGNRAALLKCSHGPPRYHMMCIEPTATVGVGTVVGDSDWMTRRGTSGVCLPPLLLG